MVKHIFFITGASGTGKTTLVSELKKKYKLDVWDFIHFDSIGIPSTEKMIEMSGSIENWQRDTTFLWIEKILKEYKTKEIIIFEGQVNIEFIKEGFFKNNYTNYTIVLIDCKSEIMTKRLISDRNQPDLVNENMINWLNFLRNQAKKSKIDIIDTSNKTKLDVLTDFEIILKNIM
jgi:dephospho-CoA kinase